MTSKRYIRSGMAITIRQTILWTGALTVVPLVAYPRTFGLGQLGFHPVFGVFEWALYFAVYFVMLPHLTNAQRVLASGFTVVYRLVCAALFAFLAALNHEIGWVDTMAVGMWSYPLAVIPHVIAAPLVLHGVWKLLFAEETGRQATVPSRRPVARTRLTSPLPTAIGALQATPRRAERPNADPIRPEERTLDDAVSYVGGYTGVRMCWVVDTEGLPLAFWQRQDYTGAVEFWAPISIEVVDFHRRRLSNGGEARPERIEVRFDAGRMIVEAAGQYWLGVLTDRDADELVGVRMSQAQDMVLKYLQERRATYAGLQEAHYV